MKRRAQQTDADDFANQAVKLQKLPLLAKANGMKRIAREKADQLKKLNQLIHRVQTATLFFGYNFGK